jgi:hypothetical protein
MLIVICVLDGYDGESRGDGYDGEKLLRLTEVGELLCLLGAKIKVQGILLLCRCLYFKDRVGWLPHHPSGSKQIGYGASPENQVSSGMEVSQQLHTIVTCGSTTER